MWVLGSSALSRDLYSNILQLLDVVSESLREEGMAFAVCRWQGGWELCCSRPLLCGRWAGQGFDIFFFSRVQELLEYFSVLQYIYRNSSTNYKISVTVGAVYIEFSLAGGS